jgi:hypothetical protein
MRRAACLLIVVTIAGAAQRTPPASSASPSQKPAAKQNPPPKPQKNSAYWLERAQSLTREITDQEFRLTKNERAMLAAQLCNSWWEVEAARAGRFCGQAGDDVSNIPQNESAEDRNQRRNAAQQVLSAAAHRDPAMRQKIVASLARDLRDNADATTRGRIADSLASAANDSDDEATTLELMTDAAKFGASAMWTLSNLVNLSQSYPQQAEALFRQALEHPSADFVRTVLEHFPSNGPGPVIPEEWTGPVIDLLLRTPLQQPSNLVHQEWCEWIMATEQLAEMKDDDTPVAPGLASPVLTTAVQSCGSAFPVVGALPNEIEAMPDDYLAVADAQTSPESRALLRLQAAEKLTVGPHPDFEVALGLLEKARDELSADSAFRAVIETSRVRMIINGARAYFKSGDYKNGWRTVERAPQDAVPVVEIELATEDFSIRTEPAPGAASTRVSMKTVTGLDQSLAREFMLRALLALQQHSPENPEVFLQWLNACLNRKLMEPEIALHAAIDGLNQWRPKDPKHSSTIGSNLEPAALSYAMTRMDEDFVLATIRTLEEAKTRISFELSALNGYLEKFRLEREAEQKRAADRAAN